jgi:hypothetical protein
MLRNTALALVHCTVLGVAVACGDNGGTSGYPSATATVASGSPTTSTPAVTATLATEAGEEPIFWRTADNFGSVQAGQPYKALFRLTNGYAEPALRVTATCQSCAQPSERQPIDFEGQRAEPGGGEAPGSYYPMNITLPSAGRWALEVVAGSDTARILVDATPGQSSS